MNKARRSITSPFLEGRVAVVTGAAAGIGRATALALAGLGANLAICDRNGAGLAEVQEIMQKEGREVVSAELDVRDSQSVADFASQTAKELGRIHVLVNNAGGGFWANFLEVSDKGRRALIDENFTSVVNFVASCVPLMPEGASIVNITSIEAFRAAPGFAIYASMKAAVEQLSRTLALELASRRIRVNCVAPDAIPTEGDASLAEAVHQGGASEYADSVPLGLGSPEDVAAAVAYLASDMSLFVTGSTIHVDGGALAASGWRRGKDGRFRP